MSPEVDAVIEDDGQHRYETINEEGCRSHADNPESDDGECKSCITESEVPLDRGPDMKMTRLYRDFSSA